MISMPLSWTLPLSLASRSMLITPDWPRKVLAVMREGLPNMVSPSASTARPLTWPTVAPATSIITVSLTMASRTRSSTRLER